MSLLLDMKPRLDFRKLEDLASEDNSTGLRGTVGSLDFKFSDLQSLQAKTPLEVLNVTGNGVFVDVNCEANAAGTFAE